jgi:hypothetical protein
MGNAQSPPTAEQKQTAAERKGFEDYKAKSPIALLKVESRNVELTVEGYIAEQIAPILNKALRLGGNPEMKINENASYGPFKVYGTDIRAVHPSALSLALVGAIRDELTGWVIKLSGPAKKANSTWPALIWTIEKTPDAS